MFQKDQTVKEKSHAVGISSNRIWIVRLGNALDADMKIISLKNVSIHLKTVRKDSSLTKLSKRAIVQKTTAMMTMTLKYTHL